jgi:hypothetical protein
VIIEGDKPYFDVEARRKECLDDYELKTNSRGEIDLITDIEGFKARVYALLGLAPGERVQSPIIGYQVGEQPGELLTDLVNNTMRDHNCSLEEALSKCASNDLAPKTLRKACLYLLSRVSC